MTKFKPMACGFHCHSDIGSLDGGSTVKLLVERHAELGRPAMCLTDHGTINGLATSHECCKKKKLLSIHGIEAYVINPIEPTKKNKKGDEVPNFSHLTIHFVSQKAYQYFCRLTPIMEERAVIIFGEKKPLITWEELEAISDEIVVGSGCLVSFCQQYILNGRQDMAELFYQKIRSLVKPGRFYVEIFPHKVTHNWQKPTKDHNGVYVPGKFVPNECQNGVPKNIQMAPNKFVLEMARKYGDRVVISEDGHLATKEEKICQDVRLGNGSTEAWKFYETYSLEDTDVWADRLQSELDISDKEMEEIIDNSYHFIEHFKDYKFKTKNEGWEVPNVATVYGDKYEGKSTKEILKVLIREHGRFPKPDHPRFQEYRDRLQSEVALFADNGHIDLLPYFFTLEDVCSWARKNNVLVSCRGSAAGALVTYLLGMSVTDPIKWELPVERMLSIPRIVDAKDLPDIDLDFDRKDLVMEYLKTKYGDRFAPISINSLMKVKAAIRDVERLERGSVSLETELMCRSLPNTTISDSLKWLNGYRDEETDSWVPGFLEDQSNAAEALRQYVKDNPELWEKITRCLGVFRQKSIHACGVLIANSPIQDLVPMTRINDRYATGYCPKGCEYVGLVKFDMLGVTTLEALNISMNSIAKSEGGEKLVWGEFPATEADFEKVFKPMKTSRIFQVATTTMTPFVRAIQPRRASDLSNICALIRPGTLNAPCPNPDKPEHTAAEYFVLCQQGKEEPYYIHEDLRPILRETHGVLLFQEQTIKIFKVLVGYSGGQAETIRRGIGKKIKELIEKGLSDLRIALEKRGWSPEQIKALCDTILASARYSFNKSHSASYGVVGNNGVYIKSRYPLHFYLGELTVNSGDRDKIKDIMRECADLILQPDILKSHPTDWCIENDRLRAPLVIVKRVGEKTAKGIVELLKNKGEGYEIKKKSNGASKDTSPHIAITGSCIINIDSSEHSDREGDNPSPADKGRPEIKSIE